VQDLEEVNASLQVDNMNLRNRLERTFAGEPRDAKLNGERATSCHGTKPSPLAIPRVPYTAR
jgi:hypothetical protein